MRLEAIDGGGQAIHLPWLRASATLTETALSAKRHPVWLLVKKELRLQQLTLVVAGLYALGWFAVLSFGTVVPETDVIFLIALTTLNMFAAPVLAGSLASAEERQMGTLEWHALLPMPVQAQWRVKALVVVGTAIVLGLGTPMLLSRLTGHLEISTWAYPLLSIGTLLAVIFVSVLSLYISSLCATGTQALLWSAAAGFVLMTLASEWVGFYRLGFRLSFDPFDTLKGWASWGWPHMERQLFIWWIAMSAIAVAMYGGTLRLLWRFARVNHRMAERSTRRMSRQVLSVGVFIAIVLTLWFGASGRYRLEAETNSRDYWKRMYGSVTVAAVDDGNRPVTSYTVVFFPEDANSRYRSKSLLYMVDPARWTGAPRNGLLKTQILPGRYSVVAVAQLGWEYELPGRRDPEVLARLKAHAIPFTIAAGESKTLNLTISQY
jgi:hypothetical protein